MVGLNGVPEGQSFIMQLRTTGHVRIKLEFKSKDKRKVNASAGRINRKPTLAGHVFSKSFPFINISFDYIRCQKLPLGISNARSMAISLTESQEMEIASLKHSIVRKSPEKAVENQ